MSQKTSARMRHIITIVSFHPGDFKKHRNTKGAQQQRRDMGSGFRRRYLVCGKSNGVKQKSPEIEILKYYFDMLDEMNRGKYHKH